jgi:hypothetical protein
LQDDVKQEAAVSLTVPSAVDPPTYRDYAKLVPPASVWVQYEVARVLRGDKSVSPQASASYALLREGIDREDEEQTDEALRAYAESVALNSRNWAARVNLATLQARKANRPGKALATVSEAIDDIRRDARRG